MLPQAAPQLINEVMMGDGIEVHVSDDEDHFHSEDGRKDDSSSSYSSEESSMSSFDKDGEIEDEQEKNPTSRMRNSPVRAP